MRNPANEPVAVVPSTGFDVTCIVGRVEFDANGTEHPRTTAFRIIGEHGAPGDFYFPHEDGGTVHVIVEHSDPVS